MPKVNRIGPTMMRRVACFSPRRATIIAENDQPSAVMEAIWPACMTLIPICTCAT